MSGEVWMGEWMGEWVVGGGVVLSKQSVKGWMVE